MFRNPEARRPLQSITLDEARVFNIPILDDSELRQAFETIDGLKSISSAGRPEFRELLRVPFNLWLTAQVLSSAEGTSALSEVASEVQLLGLYWRRRVLAGDYSIETRHLLTRMTRRMVEAYSLAVKREEVFELAAAPFWVGLLSSGVVTETGATQQRIGFSHNILFDYAVSVLVIDDTAQAIHEFIAPDFSRPLFLRPSIAYYYTRLWYDDR